MTTLSAGPAHTMVDGTVYALPPRRKLITVITSGGTIAVSNDNSTFQNITLDSNKNFESSAIFIKCTGADALVAIKTY